MEPLFFTPAFQEKIWGGHKLKNMFGFDGSEKIGEAWLVSAHTNGVSTVKNGKHAGKGLNELWATRPDLFGYPKLKKFPLLIKMLDAEDDLSVQVHPDDEYAMTHEGEQGKTECWYVIDAEPGAEIIYGHNATSKAELAAMINSKQWNALLRRVSVKAGDFFYVPSGTIHAIGKGIVIYETQQNSDTTYRVYDYDRKDEQGQLRELHLAQSLDVINLTLHDHTLIPTIQHMGHSSIITYIKSAYFSVHKWQINGQLDFNQQAPYLMFTVISGSGLLIINDNSYMLKKGVSCLLPNHIKKWSISGDSQIIATEPSIN